MSIEIVKYVEAANTYVFSDAGTGRTVTVYCPDGEAAARASAEASLADAGLERKVYSKLKIIRSVYRAGLYDAFSAFIDSLPKYVRDCWANAQDIATDDEDFGALLPALHEALGVTPDVVQWLLLSCEAD